MMEKTLGIVFAGILIAGVSLYLIWKLIERLDHLAIQLRAKARADAGEARFCRWYVDDAGNWGRVITKSPPSHDGGSADRFYIPDFLRKP